MPGQVLSMVFCNVMWGLSFIASKHALSSGFSPMTLALVRYALASACLLPMTLLRERQLHLRRKDFLPMALSGLMGITLYYFFEYQGISRTSTVNASLILAAIPILTMVAEAVIDRHRMRGHQIAGAVISVAGTAIIVLGGSSEGAASLTGDLFILGASVVWVAYIFISRRLRDGYSSLAMNTWQALIALATLIPMALADPCDLTAIPLSGWLAAAALAVICSALCYWLYGNALHEMSPLASAIFINLIPLTTLLGGVMLLGETLTWQAGVGGAMIIGSIFLVNMTEARA
ncbi:MAG: DMT family transporter [Aristaeellaceae bacterium]